MARRRRSHGHCARGAGAWPGASRPHTLGGLRLNLTVALGPETGLCFGEPGWSDRWCFLGKPVSFGVKEQPFPLLQSRAQLIAQQVLHKAAE